MRLLLVLLCTLLVWVWLTDRPSPAAPHGQFAGVVLCALLAVSVALVVAGAVRAARR